MKPRPKIMMTRLQMIEFAADHRKRTKHDLVSRFGEDNTLVYPTSYECLDCGG